MAAMKFDEASLPVMHTKIRFRCLMQLGHRICSSTTRVL